MKIIEIIIAMLTVFFIGMVFINLGTFIHEGSHTITARVLGCKSDMGINLFIGATNFDCPNESNVKNVIVAFASLFFVFTIGLFIWLFAGENSILRLLALTMFAYSLLPSAFPTLSGSDMYYIIQQGFPSTIAWIIYVFMASIVFYLITQEVIDESPVIYFKKLFG